MLVLTLATSQFGHRLIGSFMGDRVNQSVRNYGRASVLTTREMLQVIERLAPLTRRDNERRALAEHAQAIRKAADHGLSEQIDIERIHACFDDTRRALAAVGSITPEYKAA